MSGRPIFARKWPRFAARVVVAGSFAWSLGCGSPRSVTVVHDVTVRFDSPTDRSPLAGPSARLGAAARELRELLGHPLAIELDASLAPQYKGDLDSELTEIFELFATGIEQAKGKDQAMFQAARQRLGRIIVRYAPGASSDEERARFEGDDAVVVTWAAKSGDLVPVGEVLRLLRDYSSGTRASALAKMDPRAVPPADQTDYVKWLTGHLDPEVRIAAHEDREPRELARISLAIRFVPTVKAADNRRALVSFLVGSVLRDLVWNHYKSNGAAPAAEAIATWLERDFGTLDSEQRAEALGLLLGRGATSPRLLECAFKLAVRTVDAWRSAGHPLPAYRSSTIPREFELAVCPRPKDEADSRSLAPNCEGGLVRLALASEAGTVRLGELLASRKDPILVEQVMANVRYSSGQGGEHQLFMLLRAVEADPPSLRMALRVLAEDHAEGASIDAWVGELRRLWLARPTARGTILYVLVHLDSYDSKKIDFADFAGDFGAPVSADEARAYLDEGYRAITFAPILWPAFACGFSRAAVLRPHLDAYLDDPRRLPLLDSYGTMLKVRHRLCYEGAEEDLRALSGYFAARAREHPGQGVDDMSKTFDPRSCDPPSSESRGGPCVHRNKAHSVVRAREVAR